MKLAYYHLNYTRLRYQSAKTTEEKLLIADAFFNQDAAEIEAEMLKSINEKAEG